jgi:lipopolysaccharide/colanic/teichoic acid biosynthesis glycosyltransferase
MGKRGLDIVVAATALVVLSPLIVVIALAIVLESRGPIFYRALRVGHRGRPLLMLKFRKMHPGATGAPLTARQDERFTRIGRLLSKSKLDELPQLWHVLRGEMSLIGPRPEDPAFVALHAEEYEQIVAVRPGVSGLTQLAFADERRILSQDDPMSHYVERLLPQKCAIDRLYASQAGLRTDLRILAWTIVAVVLRQPVAVHRVTGATSLRRRPSVHQPAPVPALPHSGAIALAAETMEPPATTTARARNPGALSR